MISKVVLGNGYVLKCVDEVQKTFQKIEGGEAIRGLSINIDSKSEDSPSMSEVEDVFTHEDSLKNIEVYTKEVIERELIEGHEDKYEEVFGDEYLSATYTTFNSISSIYYHIGYGRISVDLREYPSNLSDAKYEELKEENNNMLRKLAEYEEALNIILKSE